MSFCKADHGFQLSGCGSDPTFGGAYVFPEFAHGDVGVYEGDGGGGGEAGLDVSAGVGDVGS